MTVVIGAVSKDAVVMGADSLSASGALSHTSTTPKIIRHEVKELGFYEKDLLIGFTNSWRFGQILELGLDIPKWDPSEMDSKIYVRTKLVDSIRKSMSDEGWMQKVNEREKAGYALIAFDKSLYLLQDEFDAIEFEEGYAAAGAGSSIAMGSMYTQCNGDSTTYTTDTIVKYVFNALEACEHHSPWCRRPFHVLEAK